MKVDEIVVHPTAVAFSVNADRALGRGVAASTAVVTSGRSATITA